MQGFFHATVNNPCSFFPFIAACVGCGFIFFSRFINVNRCGGQEATRGGFVFLTGAFFLIIAKTATQARSKMRVTLEKLALKLALQNF